MKKYREKQSESLEIRLGHCAKTEFMEACRERGLTASEVVREFVESYPQAKLKRRWSVPKPKFTEPVMNFSAVFLLSAALGTSAIMPTAATADRNDPHESFAEIDLDGDGRFDLADLYEAAGLDADGHFTQAMRDDVVANIHASIEDLDMLAQTPVLNPDFIERTLRQAEAGAVRGVQEAFHEIDYNADGHVSQSEYIAHWQSGTRQLGPNNGE